MALAETAVLAVELKLNGASQFKSGISEADAAAASLGKTTVSTGNFMGTTASKMSLLKQATVSTGAAISQMGSHLKGVLTGPLGLIGLGAGLFTVAGILKESIGKLEDFSTGLEKVQGLTGETVQQSSALILLYEKYGLGVDKVTQTVGFAEKTLGKLNNTMAAHGSSLTKLQALDKQYGLQLVDSKGHVVNYSTELTQLAKIYDSNIAPSTKAYIASQLFGKGYATMIPILKGGSAALREAAAAAASLELDPKKVDAFREGMRNLGETVNVLELRIGMALMPVLTDFVNLVNDWVRNGGSDQIVAFFKEGAVAARNFGQVMGDSVIPTLKGLGEAALAGWNLIPAPLRDWIIKGVVADRTIHFLFGVSPLHLAGSLLGDVAGPIIKTLIANRLIPQPVVIVGGTPGLPGALLDAAAGAGAGALLTVSTIVAAAAVSTWAFLQLPNGPKAGPSNYTAVPFGGALHSPSQLDPANFKGLGAAIVKAMGLESKLGGANDLSGGIERLGSSAAKLSAAAAALKAAAHAQAVAAAKLAPHILATAAAHDKETSTAIGAAVAQAIKNTLKVHAATILSTGAAHDAETSAAITALTKGPFQPSVKLDASQITDLRGIKTAANATKGAVVSSGLNISRSTSTGDSRIVGAIIRSRPITNVHVNVSATTVQQKTTVVTRYGPTGGDRNTQITYGHGK